MINPSESDRELKTGTLILLEIKWSLYHTACYLTGSSFKGDNKNAHLKSSQQHECKQGREKRVKTHIHICELMQPREEEEVAKEEEKKLLYVSLAAILNGTEVNRPFRRLSVEWMDACAWCDMLKRWWVKQKKDEREDKEWQLGGIIHDENMMWWCINVAVNQEQMYYCTASPKCCEWGRGWRTLKSPPSL